jgi:hypothetical protein
LRARHRGRGTEGQTEEKDPEGRETEEKSQEGPEGGRDGQESD